MARILTNDDIKNILYFVRAEKDITQWPLWEEKKILVTAFYPELVTALTNVEIANARLTLALNKVEARVL